MESVPCTTLIITFPWLGVSVIVRRVSMTIEGFSSGVEAPLLPANGASPRAAVWQVEGIRISVSVGYEPSAFLGRQCPRRLVPRLRFLSHLHFGERISS